MQVADSNKLTKKEQAEIIFKEPGNIELNKEKDPSDSTKQF